jgi:prepilin-type processing-associated H-X9-DG protein
MGGYTGTIIPDANSGWGTTPTDLMRTAKTIGIQDVTDGTSNTSLWSEMLSPPGVQVLAGSGRAELRVFFNANVPNVTPTAAGVMQFLAACRSLPPGTPSQSSAMGYQWWSSYPGYVNSNFNHVGPPNTRQCQSSGNNNSWGLDLYGTGSPNSLHPGGVNICFADGSVKFVKDSISLQTWWALGTRGSDDIVSADSY